MCCWGQGSGGANGMALARNSWTWGPQLSTAGREDSLKPDRRLWTGKSVGEWLSRDPQL